MQGERAVERRRVRLIVLATIFIGFWSSISGAVLVMAFNATCVELCSFPIPFQISERAAVE
jgi:hypothetical protein